VIGTTLGTNHNGGPPVETRVSFLAYESATDRLGGHLQSLRILSGITLTGQPENVVGVEVEPRQAPRFNVRTVGLKRCASGKAGFDIVPPFDLVTFTELPAKQHDAAIAQRGKVYETAAKVFELDTQSFQLPDQ
jgi:hypothetical protein